MAATAWTCPECGRRFGRRGQGHDCAPALDPEEYYASGPAFERPVHDVVLGHLRGLGDVHVEFVSVGVFVKRGGGNFVQLRTMTRWVAVHLWMPRVLDDGRIARKVQPVGRRWHHVVNVRDPGEVDEQLLGWLTEAHAAAGG